MSLRRQFIKLFTLVLLAIVLGPKIGSGIRELWQEHRVARFEVDAARSMAYPLHSVSWLEFDIPRQTRALRVLTNAAVTDFAGRPTTREQPREGWRYALNYQLLARDGTLLDDSRYHLRASVIQCRDPETGDVQAISWLGKSDWIPTMTRTVQLPLPSSAEVPGRLRIRLAAQDSEVQEVVVRVYMRSNRIDYDQSYAWSRLSPEAHDRLCRPLVYPPALLTALERQNLLRWDWTALAPAGIEGRDYRRRWFYQSASAADEIPAANQLPDGLPCSAAQHVTIPLPTGAGTVQLECERVQMQEEHSPVEIIVQRHPDRPGPSETRRWTLSRSKQVLELSADGGLLEIHATAPILCRSIWRDSSDGSSGSTRELEGSQRPLRAFLAPPNAPLDYSITSFRGKATPFCLSLRYLRPDLPLGVETVQTHQLAPQPIEYRLLDAQGLVLRRGELAVPPGLSVYDRARGTSLEGGVSEPASFYFTLDPEVRCVRVRAADDSVAVVAFTRPLDLPRTWRLPEDLDTYRKFETENRTWFMLQPDDVERRLSENLKVTIVSQMRPPVRDPEVMAGMYLWEDFVPRGFWTGRHLLTPRESALPLRDEALAATFCQLQPSRTYDVQLRAAPDEPVVEPRLIYSASELSGPIRLWLDGQPWHTFQPRARRGEVVLPRRPADETAKRHTLLIQAEAGLQLFVSHVWAENAPLYTKRLAPQFENGRMRFTVTKRSSQPEGLILRPFFPQGWRKRVQIQVRITDSPPRPEGPFDSWTLLSRRFDLRPQLDQPGLVLGLDNQRVDSGQRCFLRLASDLPAGDYTVEVQLKGQHPPGAYATLYRVLPGQHPRREAKLAGSGFDPPVLRAHRTPALHPTVNSTPQAMLMP